MYSSHGDDDYLRESGNLSDTDADFFLEQGESDSEEDDSDDYAEMTSSGPSYPQPDLADDDDPNWIDASMDMKDFPFLKNSELLVPITGGNEPIDYFRMLFDDVLLNLMVDETNYNAEEIFVGKGVSEKSRITCWKPVIADGMLTLVALLLNTGTIKLSRLQDYWKGHPLLDLKCFSAHMSRDRFLMILRCLHFARNPAGGELLNDRLHKIMPMINVSNNKIASIYYPGKNFPSMYSSHGDDDYLQESGNLSDTDADFFLEQGESNSEEDDSDNYAEMTSSGPSSPQTDLADDDDPNWIDASMDMKDFPFLKNNELVVPISGGNEPIDYFRMLFDDVLLNLMVDETNYNAEEIFVGKGVSEKSRITCWKPVIADGMLTLVALLLNTGTIKLSRLQDYWKGHPLLDLKCFSAHMSRDRFLMILRCLHFARNPAGGELLNDRLHKIIPMINVSNNKIASIYYPGKNFPSMYSSHGDDDYLRESGNLSDTDVDFFLEQGESNSEEDDSDNYAEMTSSGPSSPQTDLADDDDPNWIDASMDMKDFPFLKNNELVVPISGGNEPIDYFRMLDDVLLNLMVDETNYNAEEILLGRVSKSRGLLLKPVIADGC
ncbi:hypothetical protein JTB14_007288 [Gonioctena quinquepunctata]|nr:hypothetical protein JTB14_007288 [Gonioctena quinquepunctata]